MLSTNDIIHYSILEQRDTFMNPCSQKSQGFRSGEFGAQSRPLLLLEDITLFPKIPCRKFKAALEVWIEAPSYNK